MPTKAELEYKRTRDAIASTRESLMQSSLTPHQRKQIDVLARMSYYLGLQTGTIEHYKVRASLMKEEMKLDG